MATCHPTAFSHLLDSAFTILFLIVMIAAPTIATPNTSSSVVSVQTYTLRISPILQAVTHAKILGEQANCRAIWAMVGLCALCSAGYLWLRHNKDTESLRSKDNIRHNASDNGEPEDPGLLKKHSVYKAHTTSIATYNAIRTFYHPHSQADKLPNKPAPLPLLVFIHGLGGSLSQFASLLATFVNVAPCFGIDLPGCGLSTFSPKEWDAYTHQALVELLELSIQETCELSSSYEVILVGHSMGCSLAVSLTTSTARQTAGKFRVKGLIAICPKASDPTTAQVDTFKRLLSIPSPIFNLWRTWDQRGGTESVSVTRFVGKDALPQTKKLQLKFNKQSRTDVFRRMAFGFLPSFQNDGTRSGGLPGPDIWARLSVPLFAIAGEADHVTPPSEIEVIAKALGKDRLAKGVTVEPQISREDQSLDLESSTSGTTLVPRDDTGDLESASSGPTRSGLVLKTSILPKPAGHALFFDVSTYRTLSGLMQDFIANHVDRRLSLGWQLQHLKEANKWDVKNLAKWQAVNPVSEPIVDIFRAMKTLREVDDIHSPAVFVSNWGSKIKAIVDISHESPVYNPQGLDNGGVEYHKFPTVSKIPPTVDEVKDFIALIDHLRTSGANDRRLIGVHCHYGYNRTGFFICCYLIERMGFSVQGALDEFQARRPPGIRHDHFIDTLFVRYCVGLKRAPTF